VGASYRQWGEWMVWDEGVGVEGGEDGGGGGCGGG